MCIRAYLNGDGSGYKTHLSLFFVVMKGEYDALLKWPFNNKVSMILVGKGVYSLSQLMHEQKVPFYSGPTEFTSTENTELVFVNNSASMAGSVLYGGKLESCLFTTGIQYKGSPLEAFMNLSTITTNGYTSFISSDPTGICFLSNDEMLCDTCAHQISWHHY